MPLGDGKSPRERRIDRYNANRELMQKRSRDSYHRNKEARAEKGRIWREANKVRLRAAAAAKRATPEYKENHRAWQYRTLYGITIEQYDEMLAAQEGACAICRGTESGAPRWQVDHDHQTGTVRGLLCNSCNLALGLLKDSPEIVGAALNYLASPLAYETFRAGR